MKNKRRLSASVDATLLEAGERAVASGKADSLSAWVNEALALKVERDRALAALAAFVADFEGEHGAITPDEIEGARRRARARAVRVRTLTASEKEQAYGTGGEP